MGIKRDEIYYGNVKRKDDKYNWSELNCFYRAFAITLSSIDEKYYDIFLIYISAYVSYIINGEKSLSFDADDSVLKYYNSELNTIFNADIKKNDFTSYKNMKNKMYDLLHKSKMVIVPCDLFYLSYCKTYMELHKRHYLIVKGINWQKDILYVLDNMHNELGSSTEYSDFMIKTNSIYEMSNSFAKWFNAYSNNKYFWSLSNNTNPNFEEKSKKYLSKLCLKLIDYNVHNSFEYMIISEMEDDIFETDILEYMKYINVKKLMYSIIDRYAGCNFEHSKSVSKLSEMICMYLKERERVKLVFAVSYQKKEKCNKKLFQDIFSLLDEEKVILNLLVNIIEENEYDNIKQTNEYVVINNNGARLDFNNKLINVSLEETVVYDLWKNSDNGVIIYRECDNCYNFSIDMKMDSAMGGSSHCGIILILENENRLLFGSLGKLNIAIHRLSDNPNYELFIKNYPFEDKINLKVNFDEDKIVFLADKEILYSMKLESKIKYCGLFAKTWQKCKCDINFKINEV